MNEETTQPIDAPIHSHSLKAVATYLGKKHENAEKDGRFAPRRSPSLLTSA